MKKYRHKITGDMAIMKSNNSSFYTYDGMDIHTRIIESGNDWKEIKELSYKILKACPIEGIIYSVKRINDNEIFTIGDKVTLDSSEQFTGNITSFILEEDSIIVHYNGYDNLSQISKVKEPLFKTFDNIEIFMNTPFHYIEENKPQYSKKDMLSFGYYVTSEPENIDEDFKRWIKNNKK